jgi:mannose/fructose/N-acetylgalactosamine-specific phosphotransferase system component IIC
MTKVDWIVAVGAFCFGAVIGWVTKEAMVRSDKLSISHIAVVIGAVGGAGITKLFAQGVPFATYCIGLALAFFSFTLLVDIDDRGNVVLPRGQQASRNRIEPQRARDQPANAQSDPVQTDRNRR